MTIEEVIQLLKDEYEQAKSLKHIKMPLAYALYQVWKYVDREERNQNDKP